MEIVIDIKTQKDNRHDGNNDEDNALIARDKFMEKNAWDFMINGTKAKNRHLLAGGLLAVMQNHALYDNVSQSLRTAFAKNVEQEDDLSTPQPKK